MTLAEITVPEILVCALLLLGGLFSLAAGVGIARLPDVYIRMHAATKVGTLASGLVLAGVAIAFGTPGVVLRCVLIVLFLLLTAPIGAHMIGRAALNLGIRPWGVAPGDVPPPMRAPEPAPGDAPTERI